MDHFFMDYERHGDQWRRGYPAGTPHLERAMDNFAENLELILRQVAGREPVPWRDALRELCRRPGRERFDQRVVGFRVLRSKDRVDRRPEALGR